MKVFIIFLLLIISTSCKEENITLLPSIKSLKLQQTKQTINLCLSTGIVRDSLLIYIAGCDPEEKFFHIFNKNTLDPITSFGEKGKLFSEFIFPQFYQTNTSSYKSDTILLYDVNLLHVKRLIFFSQADSIQITGQYLPRELYFSEQLNQINDSIIIGRNLDQSKGSFFIYNTNSHTKNWIPYNFKINLPHHKLAPSVYTNFICANNNKIIVGYRYFNLIQLYDISGNLLKNIQFSKLISPTFSRDNMGISSESPLFILAIQATSEFCYIINANGSFKNSLEENLDGQLIKMDWEGNIQGCYYLETLSDIVIDEQNSAIYMYIKDKNDPEFAYINKYKL